MSEVDRTDSAVNWRGSGFTPRGPPAAEGWRAKGSLRDFGFQIFPFLKKCQEPGFLIETFCFANAVNQLKIFKNLLHSLKKKNMGVKEKHT